ncbi:MAG: penicillin-binding protein 2 [Microcella sp.]|uniref:peptidoglycan D,D-transpeptidase FtsI family protein n=1 Tax=Microcella sp. TaxID=1913979 RepID=UPI00271A4810|nr:penicillin-binding protein 2 [Microcella sp.]MDO8338083.1 penicillin-binding protein 2 [Microcella sp.]
MIAVRRTRRRLALTVVIVAAVLLAFLVRLIDIQVVRAGELAEQSEARRSIPQVLQGARGDIVDRNGVVLADTVYRYDITVSPRFVAPSTILDEETGQRTTRTVQEALGQLGALTGQDPAALQSLIDAELAADPDDDFAYLVRGVETEVYQAVRDLRIPWVYFERQPARAYPNGQVAGNLVGFLGTDGPQTGLELSADECLAATDGTSTYERGADGVRLPGTTVVEQEPVDGGTLELTIDSDVQWFAQQAIAEQASAVGADWATAFVVRVADGAVVAAADWPTVDPNDVNGTPADNLGARSFTAPYEPGSTIKALTFAALLDEGITQPLERFTVPGRYSTILNYTIGDAWAHGDLPLTTAGILMNSSNVGTSMVVERTSLEQRAEMLQRFGLDEPTGVGFLGEEGGDIQDPASIDGHSAFTQMFGQGMTATSAQVASAYQAIANGGVHMPLTLVAGCRHDDGSMTMQPTGAGERILSEQAADTTVSILESVVTDGFLSSQLSIPGYRVAAKTGTAEVAENGRYGGQRIVSLAGMAPADDPQFVVVVTLARPDTMKTSAAAAPTFRSIMTQVLKSFRVPPSTQPAQSPPLTW